MVFGTVNDAVLPEHEIAIALFHADTEADTEAAIQLAFELGGLEDGSYHLEADELEQVIQAALLANPAGQWVAVIERLPNVTQEVIVFSSFEGVCAGVLDSYGEWFAPCSEYKLTHVTHWMPLPPAPEMKA